MQVLSESMQHREHLLRLRCSNSSSGSVHTHVNIFILFLHTDGGYTWSPVWMLLVQRRKVGRRSFNEKSWARCETWGPMEWHVLLRIREKENMVKKRGREWAERSPGNVPRDRKHPLLKSPADVTLYRRMTPSRTLKSGLVSPFPQNCSYIIKYLNLRLKLYFLILTHDIRWKSPRGDEKERRGPSSVSRLLKHEANSGSKYSTNWYRRLEPPACASGKHIGYVLHKYSSKWAPVLNSTTKD